MAGKKGKAAPKKKSTRATVTGPHPPSERKWRAESDACTLAEAAAIRRDPTRMAAATKAAKTLVPEKERRAKDAAAEASAIKRLAGKG